MTPRNVRKKGHRPKPVLFTNPEGPPFLWQPDSRKRGKTIPVKSRRKKIAQRGIKALRTAADRLRKQLARRLAKAVPGLDNIMGVGVAEKVKRGKYTGKWAIAVQVRSKTSDPAKVPKGARIEPKFGKKHLTDVVETAPATPFASPGAEIGVKTGVRGTFGILIRRLLPNGDPALFILSCNHIVSRNGAFVGRPVEHPMPNPGGVSTALGLSDVFSEINGAQNNDIDAALVWAQSDLVDPLICGTYGFDPQAGEPAAAMEVFKCGANGATHGRIVALDQPFQMDYSSFPGMGLTTVNFTGLFFIRHSQSGGHFADRGDSGAVVFDTASKRPVGLVIGGIGADPAAGRPEHITLACPIRSVLAWCGGSFWQG